MKYPNILCEFVYHKKYEIKHWGEIQVIIIKDLCKSYKSINGVETVAVNNLNLILPSKGLIFIVGKSGSGKTTLLNLLGGMDTSDNGEIEVFNEKITDFNEYKLNEYRNLEVGFVFQEYLLLDKLSAKKNIEIALKLHGKRMDNTKANDLFTLLEINGLEEKPIEELSGGQKQRVAIARALVKEPNLILADEPTGALDSKTGIEIFKILKKISENRLVIVVSHDMDCAKTYGDRIIELSNGKIVKDKTITDINNDFRGQGKKTINSFLLLDAHYFSSKVIKYRKVRFYSALLLSLFTLILMGVVLSYTTFDKNKLFIQSMYESKNDYLQVYKGSLKEEDILSLEKDFPNHDIYNVYNVLEAESNLLNEFIFLCDKLTDKPYYQHSYIGESIEIDSDVANSLNFKLLAGNYPETYNEIVITDFIYSYFKDLGYKDNETFEVTVINSYSDLIGKNFGSKYMFDKFGGFTISGIISTNFDHKMYEVLKSDVIYDDINSTLSSRIQTGAESKLYFKKGFHDDLITFGDLDNDNKPYSLVISLNNVLNEDIKLFKHLDTYSIDDEYYYMNEISEQIERASNLLVEINVIFLIIIVIVAITSFLLLFNSFSTTISDETRTIQILRLLGASKKNLIKIFFSKSLMALIILVIMSPLFSMLLVNIINNTLKVTFHLHFTLFSFGIIPTVIMILFSIVSITLATIIPILSFTRNSPITSLNKI